MTEIESIKKTDLKQDDILIIRVDGLISEESYDRCVEYYRKATGHQKVLVLGLDQEIEILSKSREDVIIDMKDRIEVIEHYLLEEIKQESKLIK